jgi:hypothetical protein
MPGIEYDSNRPVVNEGHLHIGCEYACFDGLPSCLAKTLHNGFVVSLAFVRVGGVVERRPIAFANGCDERELTDDKQVSACRSKVGIHATFVIFENAHVGDLASHPFDILFRILFMDAKQNKSSGADFAACRSVYRDRGFGDSLDYRSHFGRIKVGLIETKKPL